MSVGVMKDTKFIVESIKKDESHVTYHVFPSK